MKNLFVFFKLLFTPKTVAGVMADFQLKMKQLESVAVKQREAQAKHALKVQKALAKQSQAELEEANAHQTIGALKSLFDTPQTTTVKELKQEIK